LGAVEGKPQGLAGADKPGLGPSGLLQPVLGRRFHDNPLVITRPEIAMFRAD
jgi:hypothetical protein